MSSAATRERALAQSPSLTFETRIPYELEAVIELYSGAVAAGAAG